MGMTVSWVGVQADLGAVLGVLDLVDTGEVIDAIESGRCIGTRWPSGWSVVAEWGMDLAKPGRMAALSALGETVGASISEGVMFSEVRRYRDGQQTFAVIYDCEKGFVIEGEPPAEFAPIHAAAVKAQADEDGADLLWDVPIDLMASLCGYRPDQMEDPPNGWMVLERAKTRKPKTEAGERKGGFWSRLFGG
jgi:hypothetical protein